MTMITANQYPGKLKSPHKHTCTSQTPLRLAQLTIAKPGKGAHGIGIRLFTIVDIQAVPTQTCTAYDSQSS